MFFLNIPCHLSFWLDGFTSLDEGSFGPQKRVDFSQNLLSLRLVEDKDPLKGLMNLS